MKSIIRPIEFVSPLSEVEVRMTLKELCGSKWDNYPFNGEVDKNSFRLIKNHFYMRGAPKPILIGDFVEQDKQTKISISLHTRIIDFIGLLIFVLFAISLAAFVFISMFGEGFILAIVSAIIIGCFGVASFAISYFLLWASFHRSAAKIKKALGCL